MSVYFYIFIYLLVFILNFNLRAHFVFFFWFFFKKNKDGGGRVGVSELGREGSDFVLLAMTICYKGLGKETAYY